MKQFIFTLGSDPELFLVQNNKYKSAVNLIKGSKHNPLFIDNIGNAILEDNVCVEFNTNPVNNPEDFSKNIKFILKHLRNKLPEYAFSQKSAAIFPTEELQTPQALTFGCEPDFNAWRYGEKNSKPYTENKNLRSAGGHIHIGCSIAQENPIELIKACDVFLGLPSITLDDSKERRELYGQAGSFRYKEYGVEYRTLSNFWIFHPTFHKWVYNQTKKAVNFIGNGLIVDSNDSYIIQECINTSDTKNLDYLFKKYKV